MRIRIPAMVVFLMLALSAAVLVAAQAATVQPLPTETVVPTVEVTVQATVPATVEPTAEVTAQPTTEATLQTTPEATTQATSEATAQATAVVAVTPQVASTPVDNAGFLRIANFAPDVSSVDVYVDGTLTVSGLTYPSASQWVTFQPGTKSIVVTASSQPSSSPLFSAVSVNAAAGTWQTVAVVGSQTNNSLQAAVFREDYEDLLPSTGGFTFVNVVAGSAPVNFVRNGVVYFAQIGFPGPNVKASSSLRVDSGTFNVSVVDPNHPSTVFAQQAGLELPENAYTLVALIGKPGSEQLFTLVTDRADVEIARGLLAAPGKIPQALATNNNLKGFADLVSSAGLTDLLSGSDDYTLIVPANLKLPANSDAATVLKSYIVKGKYTSRQLLSAGTLTALDGTTLKITTGNNAIYINNVRVIDLNIAATNGVIYIIKGQFKATS